MDVWVKVMGGAVIGIGSIFLLVLFSTLMGCLAGWVVGLFFTDTFTSILNQLGLNNIAMWQFGAFMGFFGGFLKTKVTCDTAKK